MFEVKKSVIGDYKKLRWDILGTFKTFDEAHKFAQENVCPDIFHEGRAVKHSAYWFSDEGSPDNPYKVCIEIKIKRKIK